MSTSNSASDGAIEPVRAILADPRSRIMLPADSSKDFIRRLAVRGLSGPTRQRAGRINVLVPTDLTNAQIHPRSRLTSAPCNRATASSARTSASPLRPRHPRPRARPAFTLFPPWSCRNGPALRHRLVAKTVGRACVERNRSPSEHARLRKAQHLAGARHPQPIALISLLSSRDRPATHGGSGEGDSRALTWMTEQLKTRCVLSRGFSRARGRLDG